MMASGNNMVLRFTSMKSPQHLLKRLAAHGLPRQGLRQLRSSHHHAGRSTKVTVKLRGLRHCQLCKKKGQGGGARTELAGRTVEN